MKIFRYTLTLIDPLFYSKEGLGGAITPQYIHATAINHAIAYTLNLYPENQPYIMSEENGGRNAPRYANSFISHDFYFTPARMAGNPRYIPEIVKGDLDGFVKKGYPGAEILRASHIFSIAPESQFVGYGISKETELPVLIRLGSFRGKTRLSIDKAKFARPAMNILVDHPVDPQVSEVNRGIMVNMFPYPIIENAVCKHCIEIRIEGERFTKTICLPQEIGETKKEEPIKESAIIF